MYSIRVLCGDNYSVFCKHVSKLPPSPCLAHNSQYRPDKPVRDQMRALEEMKKLLDDLFGYVYYEPEPEEFSRSCMPIRRMIPGLPSSEPL